MIQVLDLLDTVLKMIIRFKKIDDNMENFVWVLGCVKKEFQKNLQLKNTVTEIDGFIADYI